jgi:uncharacterized Zn-binding protein involved in type VI secretion
MKRKFHNRATTLVYSKYLHVMARKKVSLQNSIINYAPNKDFSIYNKLFAAQNKVLAFFQGRCPWLNYYALSGLRIQIINIKNMKPAARITDMHVCPMVTGTVPHVGGPILPPGSTNVLIGGLPAARVGDMATCSGPPDSIISGSGTVLINGMPAARMGDSTAHGGTIILGEPTVLIGG